MTAAAAADAGGGRRPRGRARGRGAGEARGPIVLGRRRIYILPTRQGLGFAALLMAMLLGSANYDNGLGYVLTFVLASLALVSILHTWANLAGLRLRPVPAQPVFAGDPATFELVIDNRGGRPRHALVARYRSREGAAKTGDAAVETDVSGDAATRVELVATTTRRGWHPLGRVTLASRFPLALFRAWSVLAPELRCLVYPRPVGDLPLPEGAPEPSREGDAAGDGREDFAGLRDYRLGDSPRLIHWKAVAREQGVPVKRFSGAGTRELMLDLDAAGGDLEMRLSQLTAWVLDAHRRGLRYGLHIPGSRLEPDHGEAHRDACLRALALHGEDPA